MEFRSFKKVVHRGYMYTCVTIRMQFSLRNSESLSFWMVIENKQLDKQIIQ